MREFRPPVRPSKIRVVLAVVLPLVVLVPMIALGVVALGITQVTYTIEDGALTVRSGDLFSGSRTVRVADVTEARLVTLHGGRRTAGTAMPGFCAGRFSYPDLGAVWQATNCSARAVLVRSSADERPILITPPDPEGFLTRLKAGSYTFVELPPPDKGPFRLMALIMPPIVLLSVGMVSAVLLLGPSRMRYVVGGEALEAHTLFGMKRWRTVGARARQYTPARLLRMGGTAAPGYYTGIYREDGKTTRVYATDVKNMILFEGDARVLLSPEDPEAMLTALAAEGVIVTR